MVRWCGGCLPRRIEGAGEGGWEGLETSQVKGSSPIPSCPTQTNWYPIGGSPPPRSITTTTWCFLCESQFRWKPCGLGGTGVQSDAGELDDDFGSDEPQDKGGGMGGWEGSRPRGTEMAAGIPAPRIGVPLPLNLLPWPSWPKWRLEGLWRMCWLRSEGCLGLPSIQGRGRRVSWTT